MAKCPSRRLGVGLSTVGDRGWAQDKVVSEMVVLRQPADVKG